MPGGLSNSYSTPCLNLETISRWARSYTEKGLDGLKNDPGREGEHGQRRLKASELDKLSKLFEQEAMPGAEACSRWTIKAIRALIGSGEKVTPLAGDQSKVYFEGTVARRWNPVGQQRLNADGARGKAAEIIYSALHLGTGGEVVPFVIDWQDSETTVCRLEQALKSCPHGKIVLWIDQAAHHTSEELSKAIDSFYRTAWKQTVSFLEKFGYFWREGRIHPLPQLS